jgi:hypothetical protein
MTYEEALRKAAACLRLSKSSNQAEAALAAAKAQEIMDKYQISAEVLKLDQPKEADEPVMDFGAEPAATACQKDSKWTLYLVSVVARHNGCAYYISRSQYGSVDAKLVGRASNVQTARYMVGLLQEEVRKVARNSSLGGYSRKFQADFKYGCVDAINLKLVRQREQTLKEVRAEATNNLALVKVNSAIQRIDKLRDESKAFIDDMVKNAQLKNGRASRFNVSSNARALGYEAGQSINVNSRAKAGLSAGHKAISAQG